MLNSAISKKQLQLSDSDVERMSDDEILKAPQHFVDYTKSAFTKYYKRWYKLQPLSKSGYKETIDVEIKSLVKELNRRGYTTSDSCEGGGSGTHFKNAYIAFHEDDVTKKELPKIRQIVVQFTNTPFKVVSGYYSEWVGCLDKSAGMYSIIFRGRFVPKKEKIK